jgi:hypothetical protein
MLLWLLCMQLEFIITFPDILPRSYHLNLALNHKKCSRYISSARHRDDSIITNPLVSIRPLRSSNHVCPLLHRSFADPSSWPHQPCWSGQASENFQKPVRSFLRVHNNCEIRLQRCQHDFFCPVRKVNYQTLLPYSTYKGIQLCRF